MAVIVPIASTSTRPISDNTLNAALRRLGESGEEMIVTAFGRWLQRASTSWDGLPI